MDIAQRLQELRKKAGYSQEQVAELMELSRQAVSKWESGQGKPDVDNIVKLTEVYHVSADYILLGIEQEKLLSCQQRKNCAMNTEKQSPPLSS